MARVKGVSMTSALQFRPRYTFQLRRNPSTLMRSPSKTLGGFPTNLLFPPPPAAPPGGTNGPPPGGPGGPPPPGLPGFPPPPGGPPPLRGAPQPLQGPLLPGGPPGGPPEGNPIGQKGMALPPGTPNLEVPPSTAAVATVVGDWSCNIVEAIIGKLERVRGRTLVDKLVGMS